MSVTETNVKSITTLYETLRVFPQPTQWTILASFFLRDASSFQIVSMATGTKCLPANKLPVSGEGIHDSHAEVLARRGAVRWFLEEVIRVRDGLASKWIHRTETGRFALNANAQLGIYISTVPCGDASMHFLASSQDEAMAALKDAHSRVPAAAAESALVTRGRDGYGVLGVLRTKPGRADAPSTASMCCSDKIASWAFLGIQGALGSRLLEPLFISDVVIGEVDSDMQEAVRNDCERALWKRLDGIPALCWISDSHRPAEVIINGYKRGVAPKHRQKGKFSSLYQDAKDASVDYQRAKTSLIGLRGPFHRWVRGGTVPFQT